MTVLRPPRTTHPDQPGPTTGTRAAVARVRLLALAALGGALAVVLSIVVVTVPVLLAWFADERSTVGLWQVVGIAVDVWAMAHRAVVLVDGVEVVLAPLLLALVPLLTCRYALRQVLLDRPGGRAGARVRGARAAWRALAGPELSCFVTGYLAAGLLLASLTALGPARVDLASLLPGLLLLPAAAAVLAVRREYREHRHASIDRGLAWLADRVPGLVHRGLRIGGEGLAVLMAAGAVLLSAVLVVRGERVLLLYDALDTGAVGAAVVTLGQLLLLPNMVVWALGWSTGAPLAVGEATVGWTEASGADLPLVPVLAALPEPGPLPDLLWLTVLVPVLTGAWLGWRASRAVPRLASWWQATQVALSGVLVAVVGVLALSWLALGGLTPGLLGQVGTDPWQVAGLLAGELLGGALLVVSVAHLLRSRL